MHSCLGLMKLTSIPKRELVVHNLCGSVLLWWSGLGVDFAGGASWEEFVVAFRVKYMPEPWVDA